jgi:hypothetical protein
MPGNPVRVSDRRESQEPAEPNVPVGEDTPVPGDSMEDVVRRGRWSGTPFVLLGSVAATIWLVVALVAGLALLVWWLA